MLNHLNNILKLICDYYKTNKSKSSHKFTDVPQGVPKIVVLFDLEKKVKKNISGVKRPTLEDLKKLKLNKDQRNVSIQMVKMHQEIALSSRKLPYPINYLLGMLYSFSSMYEFLKLVEDFTIEEHDAFFQTQRDLKILLSQYNYFLSRHLSYEFTNSKNTLIKIDYITEFLNRMYYDMNAHLVPGFDMEDWEKRIHSTVKKASGDLSKYVKGRGTIPENEAHLLRFIENFLNSAVSPSTYM